MSFIPNDFISDLFLSGHVFCVRLFLRLKSLVKIISLFHPACLSFPRNVSRGIQLNLDYRLCD